jgi:hypothetical protein
MLHVDTLTVAHMCVACTAHIHNAAITSHAAAQKTLERKSEMCVFIKVWPCGAVWCWHAVHHRYHLYKRKTARRRTVEACYTATPDVVYR